MPVAEYSELQGMPEDCITVNPWGYEPIPVLVPYGPIHDFIVQMKPLINPDWSAHPFMSSEEFYDLDSPPGDRWESGGLGYESAEEIDALNRFTPTASATASNTAFYHPDAKDAIVALASEAYDLFKQVRRAYSEFHPEGVIQYLLKSGEWKAFPLSVPDDEVNEQVNQTEIGLGLSTRAETRQNIRDAYHKAIHLLWCALYGSNQSKSWRENKRIYGEKYGGTGSGLLPGPSAPPPVSPGADVPPLIPGIESDVEPGIEAIPVMPRPPALEPIPAVPVWPEGEAGGYPNAPLEAIPIPEELPPTSPSKKKAAGGAGVAIALVAVVALMAAQK